MASKTYNAIYKRFTGQDWDIVHFQTNAGQVQQTSSKVFLNPTVNTINGKTFGSMSNNTWTASSITLTGSDIKVSVSDTSTIETALANRAIKFSESSSGDAHSYIVNENGIITLNSAENDGVDPLYGYNNKISIGVDEIELGRYSGRDDKLFSLVINDQGVLVNGQEVMVVTDVSANATFDDTTANKVPTKGAVAAYVTSKIESANLASTSYVDTKISNLINGAPETLDTLKEVADALATNDDVVNALEAAVGSKVSIGSVNSTNTSFGRVSNSNGEIVITSAESESISGDVTNKFVAISTTEIALLSRSGTGVEHGLRINDDGVYVDDHFVLTDADVSTTFKTNGTDIPNETAIYNYLTSNYYNKNHINTNYVSNTTLTQKLAEKATIYFSEDNASGIPTNAAPGDFWIATTGTV